MRGKCRVLVFGLVLLTVPPLTAAELVASVDSPGPLTVGDPVSVTVAARGGDESWLWGEPEVEIEANGAWELLSLQPVENADPPAWSARMAPMQVGQLELPPMRVTVRTPERRTLSVQEPGTVQVVSVLAEDGQAQPAPMREPVGVAGFPWEWVVPLMVPLLFGVMLGLLWRRRRATASTVGPSLSPIEELERTVRAIEEAIGQDQELVVCDRLAVALRRYLERRTGEPATDMTSQELRVVGRQHGWPQPVQRAFDRVLTVVDHARFAQRPVRSDELVAAVAWLQEGVRSLEADLTAASNAEAEEAA